MNSTIITFSNHNFELRDKNPAMVNQRTTYEANLKRKTPYIIPAGRILSSKFVGSSPSDPPLDLWLEIHSRQELTHDLRIIAKGTAFDLNIARPRLFTCSISDLRISWLRSQKGMIRFSGEPEKISNHSGIRYLYSLSSKNMTSTRNHHVSGKPFKKREIPPSGIINTIIIHLLCDLLEVGEGSVEFEFLFEEDFFKDNLTADIAFLVRHKQAK